ncbi:hypothetical protein FGB62_9g39 [Gracilaria domingensis]|nr:hypothetical protein FGB62_9g39 [Gracilaria domingensis]
MKRVLARQYSDVTVWFKLRQTHGTLLVALRRPHRLGGAAVHVAQDGPGGAEQLSHAVLKRVANAIGERGVRRVRLGLQQRALARNAALSAHEQHAHAGHQQVAQDDEHVAQRQLEVGARHRGVLVASAAERQLDGRVGQHGEKRHTDGGHDGVPRRTHGGARRRGRR